MTMVPSNGESPFDSLLHAKPDGSEVWSARELMPFLGYAQWRRFAEAIEQAKAVISAEQGEEAADLAFCRYRQDHTGGAPREDYELTRYAAYLTAMRGDSRKPEIRAALIYFAVKTREAEVRAEAEPRQIAAAAGPLPYREQAEILTILRPVLPESYATATGKVIMARVMGDRPELLPAETPLYAATFLAEKGHKPKTVAKFQSGFGARVSNAYFKLHGRRPEKIPGPAGSRIDKVAVYTDEDRPLLEQVYAGMAEAIRAFESGGQTALGEGEAA
ncbi:hypothetical protein [Streptomyces antimycoticus]|uniref:hypothetical protein n=1 Tax=Streptomyces antimycoticus TaxID=68175 RepID=UPI0036DFD3A8|nr:hypothetical protein OG751_04215 [Streptomyces antimycoticus]